MAHVLVKGDRFAGGGAGEARPPAAAVEFGVAVEQGRCAAGAASAALLVIVVKKAGEGALGATFAKHPILLWREALAPLFVGKADFVHSAHVSLHRGQFNSPVDRLRRRPDLSG